MCRLASLAGRGRSGLAARREGAARQASRVRPSSGAGLVRGASPGPASVVAGSRRCRAGYVVRGRGRPGAHRLAGCTRARAACSVARRDPPALVGHGGPGFKLTTRRSHLGTGDVTADLVPGTPRAGPLPFVPTASWDRELTGEEVRHLAPGEKGRRTLASLERKVARIEAEARSPATRLVRPDVPSDRAKLRRWTDPALGLWSWADPMFDHPKGRNAALMKRFADALELIRLRHRRGRGGLQRELEAKDACIATLEDQGARLIGENRQLRRQLAALLAEAKS